ncbi:MAG: MmcQ/YjbR family DNA-binding protein [Deltaproteobacteria bacterium]|nr:MmcQ/YjbR family DNA-binding protein [Deltaproteobacteria bacterium]
MVTAAQLRKIVLSFDDVEEGAHVDHADFRRQGKIFAGLTPDEASATLRLSPEIQGSIVHDGSPFTAASGAWGRQGWTKVELVRVELSVLRELLQEAWSLLGESLKAKKAGKAKPRRSPAPAKTKAPAKKVSAKTKVPAKKAPAKKKARARR